MERRKVVSLDDFVAGLRAFEKDYITKDRVAEYCGERRISDSSLRSHVSYRDERYTRNLVYQDDLFEVMLIGWRPGQRTPVHTHNGQLGWMLVERGGVEVTNFRYVSCNKPENQNVVGIDCLGGATRIDLDPLATEALAEGGPVSTVDKIQTIHQIGCPAGTRETAVTLHVYSVPFDSCISFDLAKGQCYRRNLFWDTRYGKAVTADAAAPAPPASLPLLRSS